MIGIRLKEADSEASRCRDINFYRKKHRCFKSLATLTLVFDWYKGKAFLKSCPFLKGIPPEKDLLSGLSPKSPIQGGKRTKAHHFFAIEISQPKKLRGVCALFDNFPATLLSTYCVHFISICLCFFVRYLTFFRHGGGNIDKSAKICTPKLWQQRRKYSSRQAIKTAKTCT